MGDGVPARTHIEVAADIGIAEAMLSRAADLSVDLIVMGAYGHGALDRARAGRRHAGPAAGDDRAGADVALNPNVMRTDPMLSPTDLQAVREGLDARARQLEDEIEAKRASDESGSDVVDDQQDLAARSSEALTRDAEVKRDRGELLEIAQARERLADGSYGRAWCAASRSIRAACWCSRPPCAASPARLAPKRARPQPNGSERPLGRPATLAEPGVRGRCPRGAGPAKLVGLKGRCASGAHRTLVAA